MNLGSYSRDQLTEILNYDRKELFVDPPNFDCPPIVFDLTKEPGWTVVARAVLTDDRPVVLLNKMKNSNEHFAFQGYSKYLERKQKLKELKQKELENEIMLQKMSMCKIDKPKLTNQKRRSTKRNFNRYNKSETTSTFNQKNKSDGEGGELNSNNQKSYFAKDRKNSAIHNEDKNLEYKLGSNPTKNNKHKMHTQRLNNRIKHPSHLSTPTFHAVQKFDDKDISNDQIEKFKEKIEGNNESIENVNSENKNRNLAQGRLKFNSSSSNKYHYPSEHSINKQDPAEKQKEEKTLNTVPQKHIEQDIYKIYDTSGCVRGDKKHKMPNLFRNPNNEFNKSRNYLNRNVMTPRTIKIYRPNFILGRIMSGSPELGRLGRNNSIPSSHVHRKLNSYLSNQLVKFQEEMSNNKN